VNPLVSPGRVHPGWLLPRVVAMVAAAAAVAAAAPPPATPDDLEPRVVAVAPGVTIERVAEHPDIVTPTGLDVDADGRVWVVACHTHFRPADSEEPRHDEVLVIDRDGGRRVFASCTTATMSLLLDPEQRAHPAGGWVYLAERSRILRIRDGDGDGVADVEETIATLDTRTDYPHNGLAGLAWHPDGDLLFSLGENFGADWTLTGRDGATQRGRGEGGVFRTSPDGRGLRRIARGFWNPFGLTAVASGDIYAVDNDPGSRPPCRLLEVVEGGDYGFQWVYGPGPVHPFVAWNGELRGTLGMIEAVGEGPCAVVPLGGGLVVPSWSQHRIDYFAVARDPAGPAGITATRHTLVAGGDHFRPTCLARGPDGSLYAADWVSSSYAVHGRGRLWRITIDPDAAGWLVPGWPADNEATRRARRLRAFAAAADPHAGPPAARDELLVLARSADPLVADAALAALGRLVRDAGPARLAGLPDEERLWSLVAVRKAVPLEDPRWVRAALPAATGDLRFECLRWIADGLLAEFAPEVARLLEDPGLDYRGFEAALAASTTLAGRPEAGITDRDLLAARLADPAAPPRVRGYAVRLLPADDAALAADRVAELLAVDDADLSREVIRTLAASGGPAAWPILAAVAADAARPDDLRADAVAGLAASDRADDIAGLAGLAATADGAVRLEAERALRRRQDPASAAPHPTPPVAVSAAAPAAVAPRPPVHDTAAWLARLDAGGAGDRDAGRRLFFSRRVAQCGICHRHTGRGGVVGPDLSLVARQADRAGILRAILEPDRDVAPQYRGHVVELVDGTTFTGILLRSSDVEVYRDPTGAERRFTPLEIAGVAELATSLMPAGIAATLTDDELRDLLAFLDAAP
jgi:putative membrane-bound dehydrogenase-like protein